MSIVEMILTAIVVACVTTTWFSVIMIGKDLAKIKEKLGIKEEE